MLGCVTLSLFTLIRQMGSVQFVLFQMRSLANIVVSSGSQLTADLYLPVMPFQCYFINQFVFLNFQ